MKKALQALFILAAVLAAPPAFAFGGGHWTSWAHRQWIPGDIPGSCLAAWYRPETLGANGTAVATWSDQSGTARDITQASAGNRPTVTASAVNGYSAVTFVGASSHSLADAGVSLVAANGSYAMAMVWQWQSSATGKIAFGNGGNSGGFWFDATLSSSATWRGLYEPGQADAPDKVTAFSTAAFEVTTVRFQSGTVPEFRRNNNVEALTGATTSLSATGTGPAICMGAQYAGSATAFATGQMAEAMIFTCYPATADMVVLNHYLGGKYALAITQ